MFGNPIAKRLNVAAVIADSVSWYGDIIAGKEARTLSLFSSADLTHPSLFKDAAVKLCAIDAALIVCAYLLTNLLKTH